MIDRDEIARMAREAQWLGNIEGWTFNSYAELERFFRLAYEAGAAAEREACAQVCEIPAGIDDWEIQCGADGRQLCNDLASAIRARGSKT